MTEIVTNLRKFSELCREMIRSSFTEGRIKTDGSAISLSYIGLRLDFAQTELRLHARVVPTYVIKISIRFDDINSVLARATMPARRLTSLNKAAGFAMCVAGNDRVFR